jgi:hypothetical protein
MEKFTALTKTIFNFRKQIGDNGLVKIAQVNEVIDEVNRISGALNNSVQYVGLLAKFKYSSGENPQLDYSIVGGGAGCNHFCGNDPNGTGCYNNCNEAACVGCYRTLEDGSATISDVISSIEIIAAGHYRITFDPTLYSFVTPGNAVFVPAGLNQPWYQAGYIKVSDYVYDLKTADLSAAPVVLSDLLNDNFIEIRFYKVDINLHY